MSNEMKASVSDFKHKFYDECIDGKNDTAPDSHHDDSIDPDFLREFIERVKRSASLGRIKIPEWVVTDDDFVEWVRNHE